MGTKWAEGGYNIDGCGQQNNVRSPKYSFESFVQNNNVTHKTSWSDSQEIIPAVVHGVMFCLDTGTVLHRNTSFFCTLTSVNIKQYIWSNTEKSK